MSVTSTQWIEQASKYEAEQDWESLRDFRHRLFQSFADKQDWSGLERFFTEVLAIAFTPDIVSKVTIKSIVPFEAGIAATLREAVLRAQDDPAIQAIYFEYFYDGAAECNGNAFLCTQYDGDDEDGNWASEFEDLIEGPIVADYLNYDPDLELDLVPYCLPLDYVHAFLLAAWARAVAKLEGLTLPMAFAEHDRQMIVLNPSA